MSTRRYRTIAVAGCLALLAGVFFMLPRGEPWGEPMKSPDGRFELRFLRVRPIFKFRRSFPGQGSDDIEGYVILYDLRTGREVSRCYQTGMSSEGITWSNDAVSSIGVGDQGFWMKLPSN